MKTNEELQELYKECMEFWGFERQSRVAQEECAELITAISHALRGRPEGMKEVIEECADVYLMINQLITYFGEDVIMEVVDLKSNKVRAKLEKYKEKEKDGN